MKLYAVNEIFYSLQGEGIRAGTANIFVRFAGCNLKCSKDDPESGFDCDTEFNSFEKITAKMLVEKATSMSFCRNVIFTGGEPGAQLDAELIAEFRKQGKYHLAIETNGTFALPDGLDWITVSPKSAMHTLRQKRANEVKLVRHAGQMPISGIQQIVEADYYLLSPAFNADGSIDQDALRHCIELVKTNPTWRLSVQQHKYWRVR